MTIVYILAAILIFGLLIAVHELGHFLAAKASGVQVNEFSIGMGPEIWSRTSGETQYSLRLLPIGGFCAMEGEEEASDSPRALNRQGFWKKLLIFAAGALMNLLMGFVILLILYSGTERYLIPQIGGVAPEFQARYGDVLQPGDVFYAINGERVYIYGDEKLLLSLKPGEPLDLTVLRDGKKVVLEDLVWDTYTRPDDEGYYNGYGIYRTAEAAEATALQKLRLSWLNTVDFARIVRLSLQMLVNGDAGLEDVGGPVMIVSTITEVGQSSENVREAVDNILYFAALIAVNLAVMNLLPIPALDGGHIAFLLLNTVSAKLFGRHIPDRYETPVSGACFALLMGFMVFITFYDVFRLIR